MEKTLFDKRIDKLKNNKIIVAILIMATIYFGVSKFLKTTKENIDVLYKNPETSTNNVEKPLQTLFMRVKIVDKATKLPISKALVKLEEMEWLSGYTDNEGFAVINLPDKFDDNTYASISISHNEYNEYVKKLPVVEFGESNIMIFELLPKPRKENTRKSNQASSEGGVRIERAQLRFVPSNFLI